MTDIRNRCVHCGEDTRYGYACHECAMKECDRCPEILALDEEVTPYDCGTEADFFRDGAFRVHYKCLTKEEKRAWLDSYIGLDMEHTTA
jgi:hypothetical protein